MCVYVYKVFILIYLFSNVKLLNYLVFIHAAKCPRRYLIISIYLIFLRRDYAKIVYHAYKYKI